MDRLELVPGLWVDAGRALWLAGERTLVVADLHLGYAWEQRRRGALLPLADVEDAGSRLRSLQQRYQPDTFVFLGDLVHGPYLGDAVGALVREILSGLGGASELVLTVGNHDAAVSDWIAQSSLPLRCVPWWRAGRYLLLHGDGATGAAEDGFLVMGHEHPSLVLGDPVARLGRCPCFLEASQALMLPAFSRWAAGVVVGRQPFLSERARAWRWHAAIAIVGDRLLRLPIHPRPGGLNRH
jgi:hypothetical protein